MARKTKQGFTLIELIVAMVVLSLAGLILAVCMRTAWKMKAQASLWQQDNAELSDQVAQNDPAAKPAKVNLLPVGNLALKLTTEAGRWFTVNGVNGVTVNFESMDWSALRQSGAQAQPVPTPAPDWLEFTAAPVNKPANDPILLPDSGNYTTGEAPLATADGAYLAVDQFELKSPHTNLMLTAEAVSLNGNITAEENSSITAAPASGGQPLLLYAGAACSVLVGGTPRAALATGWYAVPAGTDLLAAGQDDWNGWLLNQASFVDPVPLPGAEPEAAEKQRLAALTAELDKAYARLKLAGAIA